MRGDYYANHLSIVGKVLRLHSHKMKDIMPLFFYYVSDGISPNPTAKLRIFGDNQ